MYNGRLVAISFNRTVLMSGAAYFGVKELNPYSRADNQPNREMAARECAAILQAFEEAGIKVITVADPPDCQDGVFTANWGLCRGNKAILSSLPPGRQEEEAWAKKYLEGLGKEVVTAPYRFSGQGDALPCGDMLFAGSVYRTDKRMHSLIAETLGYRVISLETMPQYDDAGKPVVNRYTGWPDSPFYDLDLALAVLKSDLIAWCPEAFTAESQTKIRDLGLDAIEVSLHEAKEHFACNLVSTGKTVIMSDSAPQLRAAIEARGFKTITPKIRELAKGGGYIRCVSLTLDNE